MMQVLVCRPLLKLNSTKTHRTDYGLSVLFSYWFPLKRQKWESSGNFIERWLWWNDSCPGWGGALPYKAIREVPFFRVSFFSINSWMGYENWSEIPKRVMTLFKNKRLLFSRTICYCFPYWFPIVLWSKNSETGYQNAIFSQTGCGDS